ncbi:MAG TPA: acetyl-CoA carboxylase biotin carboxyl carrier protein subunit [Pyrinomonadaceae bacterium]|jgi:biotin carboxyl carrier protein|nr:acetyl-CoA carboxylase biotin carboxyl carrier protein subunit [Pyrinomonadaceae bacterium]
MKYKAQIENIEHVISLELAGDSATAEIDGRRYEIEHRRLRGGEYLLINGSAVYKCRVEGRQGSNNSFSAVLGRAAYDITLVDPKRLSSALGSAGHDHGSAEILSPMPGKIVRVLVEVGAKVEAGAGIIVVEAMKMQNEMKAPKAGVVVSINAEAGATVNAGDVLAVIE